METYIVEIEGEKRQYKDKMVTLPVWSPQTCDKKIAEWAAAGNLKEKFDELHAWQDKQPDAMHRDWAHYCEIQMTYAHDRFMATQAAKEAAINLFD